MPDQQFLVYVSSAAKLFGQEELLLLLAECREHNERHGITGLLLYNKGNFMQAIEGDQAAVKRVFASIEKDRRHTGLIVIDEGANEVRQFPGWAMGFVDVDMAQASDIPGYSSFLSTSGHQGLVPSDSSCWTLLNMFKKSM
jgi:hypothetical protein